MAAETGRCVLTGKLGELYPGGGGPLMRVNQIRHERGLSVRDLATRIGRSNTRVGILLEQTRLAWATIEAIAAALEVPAEDIAVQESDAYGRWIEED